MTVSGRMHRNIRYVLCSFQFQSISAVVKTPLKCFDEKHESLRRGKGRQTVCYDYMTAAGVDVANVYRFGSHVCT